MPSKQNKINLLKSIRPQSKELEKREAPWWREQMGFPTFRAIAAYLRENEQFPTFRKGAGALGNGVVAVAKASPGLVSKGAKAGVSRVRRAVTSAVGLKDLAKGRWESVNSAFKPVEEFLNADLVEESKELRDEEAQARLDSRTDFILRKVAEQTARIRHNLKGNVFKRMKARGLMEQTLAKGRNALFLLHTEDKSEAETPDPKLFEKETFISRNFRRVKNVANLFRPGKPIDYGPRLSEGFYDKYRGTIIETADGQLLLVPNKPEGDKHPVFFDVLKGKSVWFLNPHFTLNPMQNGKSRITLVHSNIDYQKILAKIERLRLR